MPMEGTYMLQDGRCAICGKDWPHIHTLEEVETYEQQLRPVLRRDEAIRAAERSRIRRELEDAVGSEAGTCFVGELAIRAVSAEAMLRALDRICPEAPGEVAASGELARLTGLLDRARDLNSRLLAALPPEVAATFGTDEASPWQPIETAPKDGTYILLFWPFGPPAVARWRRGVWMDGSNLLSYSSAPSHWMPLPAGPG